MFYHNLTIYDDGMYLNSQDNGVDIGLDEDTLCKILGAPTVVNRSIRSDEGSAKFFKIYGALDDMKTKDINKKALKREYQLLFELMNKALLPRSEKRTIVTRPNLYLMEVLSKYHK